MSSPLHKRPGSAESFLPPQYAPSSAENEFNSYVERDPETTPTTGPRSVPTRTSTRNVFLVLFSWPTIVICGHLILQGLGWGFFAAVKARGQIPLQLSTALWVKRDEHTTTLIITLISTFLASCSSFLFSYAIRRSLSLYLYRPMSLATLGASINISMRQLVFGRGIWHWAILSIIVLVLSGIQTSGWSTLLTPVTIVITTPLAGSEIDLASPVLRQTWRDGLLNSSATNLSPCVIGDISNNYHTLSLGLSESGYSAAQTHLGYPSSLTVMNQTFNASTNGIMPSYMQPLNVSDWLRLLQEVPPSLANISAIPEGLLGNYSAGQHDGGHIMLGSEPDEHDDAKRQTQDGGGHELDDCAMENQLNKTEVYATNEGGAMMMVVCKNLDGYSLVLVPYKFYQPSYVDGRDEGIVYPSFVCAVKPKISRVIADYAGVVDARADHSVAVLDPDGPAGHSAVYAISLIMRTSQNLEGSAVADQWGAMNRNAPWSSPQILTIMEEYFKGVVEYTGTVLRTCLSANDTFGGVFKTGIPPSMTVPVSGEYHTQTLGWAYASGTTRWVLVPGTLIAFASIVVTVVALVRNGGTIPRHSFDPSDPLHLVAAAAAGDLNSTFRDMKIKEGVGLNIVLGWVPDKGPALLRTDQHDPFVLHSR
ncbi:hypothetical protein C8R43DRAFT_1186284 [Mycena crocata]|nr:hypothetical protein C8R43DRAFT_1186284 [Mycena crocata]